MGTEEASLARQRLKKRGAEEESASVPAVTALGGETSARTAEVRPEKQESKRKAEDQSAGDGDAGAKGDGSENGAVRKRPRRN